MSLLRKCEKCPAATSVKARVMVELGWREVVVGGQSVWTCPSCTAKTLTPVISKRGRRRFIPPEEPSS